MSKFLGFTLLSVLVAGLILSIADPIPHVEIIKAGTYLSSDVNVKSTDGWWGLLRTGNGFELQPTAVEISPDDTLTGVFGQSPMTKVETENSPSLVVLVHGLENPQSGPVESTPNIADRKFLYPGEHLYLHIESGDSIQLYALGEAIIQDSHDLLIIHNYSLHVRRGYEDAGQTIYSADVVIPGGPPYLDWSGDLNRDGQIDLFFDLTNHEVGNNYTLFLSTPSKPEIVRNVAAWSVSGC